MRCLAVFMMLAGLTAGSSAATPEQIVSLIEQLGSTDYRQRQAAFRELDALGEVALASLKARATSGDSETRSRAAELIRRIELRQTSARVLAPTLVELNIENMSVRDAVQKVVVPITQLPLALAGNLSKIDRKVTYHSGKVPVWEAVAGFLRAAHLSEWDGITSIPGLPAPQVSAEFQQQVFFGGGNVRFRNSRGGRQPAINQILLYDGESMAMPSCLAGAVRIRALPVSTPIPNATGHVDELMIPLQVSSETKVDWMMTPASIKIASARDDHGQNLTASVVNAVPNSSSDPDMMMVNMMIANQMMMSSNFAMPRGQFVPLRLTRGATPSKTLKEINGIMSLSVRVPGELAVIEAPLKADMSRQGEYAELTLHSVERTDDGHYKIDLSLLVAPEAQVNQLMTGDMRFNGAMIQVQPRPAARPAPATNMNEFYGISLVDAKNARYSIGTYGTPNISYNTDGTRVRTTLTFVPKNGVGEPARLTVNGAYPAAVELAFSLKDVPIH